MLPGSVHRLIVSPLPVQVSGCGDGLGRALSLQLARQGCRLICIDQNPLQVQETLGLVQSQQVGTQGRTAPCRIYARSQISCIIPVRNKCVGNERGQKVTPIWLHVSFPVATMPVVQAGNSMFSLF